MNIADQEMINDIAEDIADIINRNVRERDENNHKWEWQLKSYHDDIKRDIENTEEIIQDYTEENLTFNRIEQEGYLRCLKTQCNILKEIIKSIENSEELEK